MQPHDVACLNALLVRFYGSHWPGLTHRGAELWVSDLCPYPYDLASQAIRQWYRGHLPDCPPTLAQLLELIDALQARQRRQGALQGDDEASRDYEPLYEPH